MCKNLQISSRALPYFLKVLYNNSIYSRQGGYPMSNKLTIEIYGTRYSITSTEDEKYVQSLAQEIDEMLTHMMQQSGISLNQAYLLLALHYLDSLKKGEQGVDHMREQVSEYLKDANTARDELAAALQKLERLEHRQKMQGAGMKGPQMAQT